MINFGQLKNNIQILRKYLTKMNGITQCQIKPQWIQQKFLRQNNPHIFLQLLHYFLIKFSPFTLFVKVLDYYPTIKDDSDKKFINNVMILSRKMFDIDVKIDLEQFFSTKFLQKKTQFISSFSKAAYQFHIKQNKPSNLILSNIETKKVKQNKLINYLPQKIQKYNIDDDNQEQQQPRHLNLIPSNSSNRQKIILDIKKKQSSSEDQDLKELIKNKNKLKQKTAPKINKNISYEKNIYQQKDQNKKNTNKPNKFVQKIQKNDSDQDSYPAHQVNNNKRIIENQIRKQKSNQTYYNNNLLNQQGETNQIDLSNYVSRQQFMDIITSMNKNFNEILSKFNQFQGQVAGWIQNVNAKISILEQNVKTIKNNL